MTTTRLPVFKIIPLVIITLLISSKNVLAEIIILDRDNTTHITFKKIKPGNYFFKEGALKIQVNNSASFLLLPFENTKQITKVSFQWKKKGTLNTRNSEHEETRQGDDAYLRVGLALKGKNTIANPLAPKWAKQVRQVLHHASNKMIYLTPGSKHKVGEHWKSPYSDDVDIIAISSEIKTDGWNYSEHIFNESQSVVGLWIMADGDNTQSTFTSMLKSLTLE